MDTVENNFFLSQTWTIHFFFSQYNIVFSNMTLTCYKENRNLSDNHLIPCIKKFLINKINWQIQQQMKKTSSYMNEVSI